ncbi:hypothetical protein ANN_05790, partial [Periplaneta americana]
FCVPFPFVKLNPLAVSLTSRYRYLFPVIAKILSGILFDPTTSVVYLHLVNVHPTSFHNESEGNDASECEVENELDYNSEHDMDSEQDYDSDGVDENVTNQMVFH